MEIRIARHKDREFRKYRNQRHNKVIRKASNGHYLRLDFQYSKFEGFFMSLYNCTREEVYEKLRQITIKGKPAPYSYIQDILNFMFVDYENGKFFLQRKYTYLQEATVEEAKRWCWRRHFYFDDNDCLKFIDGTSYYKSKSTSFYRKGNHRHIFEISGDKIKMIIYSRKPASWKHGYVEAEYTPKIVTYQITQKDFDIRYSVAIREANLLLHGQFSGFENNKYGLNTRFSSYRIEDIFTRVDDDIFYLKKVDEQEITEEEVLNLTALKERAVFKHFRGKVHKKVNIWVTSKRKRP